MKNDLISRQAAIKLLDEQIRQCNKAILSPDISLKDEYAARVERASLNAYREHLSSLPSVEAPDINVGNIDTISRQQAINAVYKNDRHTTIRQRLDALPSAQPETAKRIVGKSRDGMTLWYQCDMCNEPVDAQDNYCRGCGRRLIDE